MQLVLSLFSGIGLLDKAFREAGFIVVSAGDLITGQDIRNFKAIKGKFSGIIGGSPCQDFSGLKRKKGNYSLNMMYQFLRIVKECEPDWYLLENVKGVPNITDLLNPIVTLQQNNFVTQQDEFQFDVIKDISVTLRSYNHQRIDINQGWYDSTSRLRHVQFGSINNLYLDIPRCNMKNIESSCALASDNRSFKELCHIQGLENDFDLPDFNVQGKKRAVGNAVPLSVGRVLANSVLNVTHLYEISQGNCDNNKSVTKRRQKYTLSVDYSNSFYVKENRCQCGCGRVVTGRKNYFDSTCRKRAQRKRDSAAQQIK